MQEEQSEGQSPLIHDVISLNILKNRVAGNAVIAFSNKKLYHCTEKSYKIRDHTPDFLIKFGSTLSNFMDLCIRSPGTVLVIIESLVPMICYGDKWNQTKSAVGTAFNKDGSSMGQRLQNARKNGNTQGELNGMNKFGTMTGMAANRRGQISRRGGTAY